MKNINSILSLIEKDLDILEEIVNKKSLLSAQNKQTDPILDNAKINQIKQNIDKLDDIINELDENN